MSVGPSQVESSVRVLSASLVAFVLAYVGLAVAAVVDSPWAYVAVLAVVAGLEWVAQRVLPALVQLLKVCQLGIEARGLIQTLTFALLLARQFDDRSALELALVVALAMALPTSRAVYLLVLFQLRAQLTPSLEVRNVDLGPLAGSPVPRVLTDQVDRRLVQAGTAVLMVGAVGVIPDLVWPFVVLASAYVLALCVGVVVVVVRLRGRPSGASWERQALDRIRALNPEVILYFSGSADATYQLDMWLQPVTDLGRPALVLVRERHVLDDLAPTDLPVVCMPNAVTVMQAKLSTARVAFYAAHTSKNIHLLRERGMRHVFIGHGDSDKVSSINPFAKAYDEVWVAGRAGRDRWATADVGVRDDAVVEVGRPQLEAITRNSARAEGEPLTVLYAPTWEGWTDEDFSTSLTHMGPPLVRGLLEASPPVRIVYKPHPFTGIRDKRVTRSHEAIVAMLAAANAPAPPAPAELLELERRLAVRGLGPAEAARLSTEWSRLFWAHQPPERHVVVDDVRPAIVDCFNHADVLVSDVSSVVSDFLASGKPYVCTNPDGTPSEQFVEENPSVGAAYLLGPDCAELTEILASVGGADPKVSERRVLREYLLGPDEPAPIVRWRAAVEALAATVDGRSPSTFGEADAFRGESDDDSDADDTGGDGRDDGELDSRGSERRYGSRLDR